MANSLGTNPVIVDTAQATKLLSGPLNIIKIRWVDTGNDIADGDQAIIQDAAGAVVWQHRISTVAAGTDVQKPGAESDFHPSFRSSGLLVPTLTHGTLYLYLEQAKTAVPVKV